MTSERESVLNSVLCLPVSLDSGVVLLFSDGKAVQFVSTSSPSGDCGSSSYSSDGSGVPPEGVYGRGIFPPPAMVYSK